MMDFLQEREMLLSCHSILLCAARKQTSLLFSMLRRTKSLELTGEKDQRTLVMSCFSLLR